MKTKLALSITVRRMPNIAMVARFVMAIIGLLMLLIINNSRAEEANDVTTRLLDGGDLSTWEYHAFDDILETSYEARFDDDLQATVIFADSMQGASGYVKKMPIDLEKTPWLHFRWRVDQAADGHNEEEKSGDDFAFRIYFAVRDGLRYKSLSLVRSQRKRGEHWRNPYANFINDLRTYVVIGGDAKLSTWHAEHINLLEIWSELFEEKPPTLELTSFMTDGDSSGSRMRARYGDIILSNSQQSPF